MCLSGHQVDGEGRSTRIKPAAEPEVLVGTMRTRRRIARGVCDFSYAVKWPQSSGRGTSAIGPTVQRSGEAVLHVGQRCPSEIPERDAGFADYRCSRRIRVLEADSRTGPDSDSAAAC